MSATFVAPRSPILPGNPVWGLLQRAQGYIQKWPEGFRGYRARVRCEAAGAGTEGAVVLACGRDPVVELAMPAPALHALIRNRLLEHVDERTPRFFKDGDGRFDVRPDGAPGDGPWIRVERPDATIRYRLDGRGRIEAVERLDGEQESLTVIEEYVRATPGRVLPARRRTTRRDARTGACTGQERLVESHCRIDHVWLPASWDLVADGGAGSHAFRLEVFAHQLL
jgi:hypothetical protein